MLLTVRFIAARSHRRSTAGASDRLHVRVRLGAGQGHDWPRSDSAPEERLVHGRGIDLRLHGRSIHLVCPLRRLTLKYRDTCPHHPTNSPAREVDLIVRGLH
jgi:hypothetical protein